MTIFERLADAIHREHPIALITRLDGAAAGAKLLVDAREAFGSLGSRGLDYAATAEARALLAVGGAKTRALGEDGEPTGVGVHVFVQAFAPAPAMYVFGAIDFSRAMTRMGQFLGYRVTVVDARPVFATRARFPDADDVVVAWPDEFLAQAHVDERTAIVVLTHDPKFDIPLLTVALRTNAAYIGVMGSRGTQADRVPLLREAGVSDADMARICAPVGLDLGAQTPEETAVSIAAELIALRHGREGGRLTGGTQPIHDIVPSPVAS